jgi:D-alanyl-D-alanine carboxypeptidase
MRSHRPTTTRLTASPMIHRWRSRRHPHPNPLPRAGEGVIRRARWITATTFCVLTLLSACGGGDDAATERRAEIVATMSARIRTLHAQYPSSAGIVVHVLDERSGLSWAGSTGVADRAAQTALKPNATFRTASVTKVFTAATIHRLAERGELVPTDAIERHLSADSVATLRAGGYDVSSITIDHLLTHRSGLPDHALSLPYWQAVLADPTHRWSRAEQLAVAMSLGAPLFAPGSDYRYSDTGYLLLGEMIERHTGQALGPAFRDLLRLESLGLASTYQESIEAVPAAAGPRAKQDLLPGLDDSMIDASTDLWGAGGLVSDGRDLALFTRALLEGRVLGPAATQAMLTVATEIEGAGFPAAYARGIARVQIGATICWGHDAFSGAFTLHCPSAGITLAGSINATELTGAPGSMDVATELVRALESLEP